MQIQAKFNPALRLDLVSGISSLVKGVCRVP